MFDPVIHYCVCPNKGHIFFISPAVIISNNFLAGTGTSIKKRGGVK